MDMYTCYFNMDTGCVDAWFRDGTILSIDCTKFEQAEAEWADYLHQLHKSRGRICREYVSAVGAGLSDLQRSCCLCGADYGGRSEGVSGSSDAVWAARGTKVRREKKALYKAFFSHII